jgi:hypothetical protein
VRALLGVVTQARDAKERQVPLGRQVPRRHRIDRVAVLSQEELLHHHAVLGQRSRLVGADDGRGAERSDRRQVADQHVAPGHALRGQHEGQCQSRQQSFRHHRHDDADGEDEGVPERHPGDSTDRKEDCADQRREDSDLSAEVLDLLA